MKALTTLVLTLLSLNRSYASVLDINDISSNNFLAAQDDQNSSLKEKITDKVTEKVTESVKDKIKDDIKSKATEVKEKIGHKIDESKEKVKTVGSKIKENVIDPIIKIPGKIRDTFFKAKKSDNPKNYHDKGTNG